ncbi:MAG: hypothetical protein R3F59_32395 [Myxococcota bacterium]
MRLFAARLGALKWLAGGSIVGLLGLAAVGLVALVVLALVVRLVRSRTGAGGLRRRGYAASAGGRYTRSVQRVRVEYEPRARRFVARTGVYAAADFVSEPLAGERPEDGFLSGDPEIDEVRALWSERPPFAKQLLADGAVKEALLAMPSASVALRGDELVVEVPRVRGVHHERVVQLAAALASAAAASAGGVGG